MGRNQGRQFEHEIEATFEPYAKGNIARLALMPMPTRIVGMRNGRPELVHTGKPPWDVVGYLVRDGRMIGAELKCSSAKNTLPIVGPGKKGDGIQFHQIDALAALALAGGLARIVWSNDGEVGVLTNSIIIESWRVFMDALKTERSGKTAQMGAKSMPWDLFKPLEYGPLHGGLGVDWLQHER